MKGGLSGLMKTSPTNSRKTCKKPKMNWIKWNSLVNLVAVWVQVVMTGRHDVKGVMIDNSVMDDKDMLEDLIAAAVNDAVRKVEKTSQEKMSGMAGGLDLGGMKLPF